MRSCHPIAAAAATGMHLFVLLLLVSFGPARLPPASYPTPSLARSWATEASWSLDDIASGGAPTECKFSIDGSFCNNLSGENAQIPSCGDETDDAPVNVNDDCTDNLYQLVLIDAYGDGAPPLGRS